jgi:hypothetical protein
MLSGKEASVRFEGFDERIERRLITALISQWNRLPRPIQETLLTDACLADDPGALGTTSLRERIISYIGKHGDALGRGVDRSAWGIGDAVNVLENWK